MAAATGGEETVPVAAVAGAVSPCWLIRLGSTRWRWWLVAKGWQMAAAGCPTRWRRLGSRCPVATVADKTGRHWRGWRRGW